jgi:hypothetical protein
MRARLLDRAQRIRCAHVAAGLTWASARVPQAKACATILPALCATFYLAGCGKSEATASLMPSAPEVGVATVIQ